MIGEGIGALIWLQFVGLILWLSSQMRRRLASSVSTASSKLARV
jgi:hypothetical protein